MVKLKQIASILVGYPFRGRVPEKVNSGIFVVHPKDVSSETGVSWGTVMEVELTGKRSPDWLQDDDILFSARGAHNYATIIKSGNRKAVCSPYFYVLRVKNKQILPAFLAWQINQLPIQCYFEREAEGSLVKSLRRSVIENIPLVIPSLEEQQRIISLSEALQKEKEIYHKLIDNNQRLMNRLSMTLVDKYQEKKA